MNKKFNIKEWKDTQDESIDEAKITIDTSLDYSDFARTIARTLKAKYPANTWKPFTEMVKDLVQSSKFK